MLNPWLWKISWRQLRSRRNVSVTLVSIVTVLGIAFAVMAWLVALAVINGFEREYQRSILSFNAHIVIMRGDNRLDPLEVEQAIKAVIPADQLRGHFPFRYQEALAVYGQQVRGIAIKVLDLPKYWPIAELGHQQRAGDPQGIWIGSQLATAFGLSSDPAVLKVRVPEQAPEGSSENKSTAAAFLSLPIAGTFHSGIYDYDASFALIDWTVARHYFPADHQLTGVELWLYEPDQAIGWAAQLAERLPFPYTVTDWQQLNAGLFGALQLERLIFSLIMGLLLLVASFNITGGLTMRILERRAEIAILKTMGASWRQIRKLFLFQGFILAWLGYGLGVLFAVSGIEFIEHFKLLRLNAEIYFIDFVPAAWKFAHLGVAFGLTSLFAWLATRIALLRLKRLSISQALGEP